MRPIYLYIEDFMCYDKCELDFSQFNSALIIGKLNNNDLFSNGVGKSTIFKAIEYVLFNQVNGLKLEELIRDDCQACKVIFDFEIDGKVYRLSRSRSTKGTNDLSLYELIEGVPGEPHSNLSKERIKVYWHQKSGRRTSDTETDVAKLIKINFKGFINSFHFSQNDYSGLATVTASKRRAIFKETLQIGLYSKIEKLAKDKFSILSKDLDKSKTLLSLIGEPKLEISKLETNKAIILDVISEKTNKYNVINNNIEIINTKINSINSNAMVIKNQILNITAKKTSLENSVNKLTTSFNEASLNKKKILDEAKTITKEIAEIKSKIIDNDYSEISSLNDELNKSRDVLVDYNAILNTLKNKIIELKLPLPEEAVCKHCRQTLTDTHRRTCKNEIDQEISQKEMEVSNINTNIFNLKQKMTDISNKIKLLENEKKNQETIKNTISVKEKDLINKKSLFENYNKILEQSKKDLTDAQNELENVNKELSLSNKDTLNDLQNQINQHKFDLSQLMLSANDLSNIIIKCKSDIAVIDNNISEKQKEILKKEELINLIKDLEEKSAAYPDVIEAFGPTGISNLMVQSLLDDLQNEANNILNQIKPGLQLEFLVEKTNSNGELDDDLDIKYYVNGRTRAFAQISGAMKLAVMFALKLGYAYILYKITGVNMKFLLLDEVDAALDKGGIDALADIINYFQKDFTILTITHNDRLKDKFKNIILVEQDANMVSSAKLMVN